MTVRTIAVIGAGALGRTIALAAVVAGYRVVLEDVSRQSSEQSLTWIRSEMERNPVSGQTEAAARDEMRSRLTTAASIEDAIRDADLIIETVPDELEMKLELFTIFDKFAKPDAIFATATSLFSVGDITDVVVFRERCIGMRFHELGSNNEFIEIVQAPLTSAETLGKCLEVAQGLAKQVAINKVP